MTTAYFFPSYLLFLLFGLYAWAIGGAVFTGMRGIRGIFQLPWLGYALLIGLAASYAFVFAHRSVVLGRISHRHIRRRRSHPSFKGASPRQRIEARAQGVAQVAATWGGVILDLYSGFQRLHQACLPLRSRTLLSPRNPLDGIVPDRSWLGQFDIEPWVQPKRVSRHLVLGLSSIWKDWPVACWRIITLAWSDAIDLCLGKVVLQAQKPTISP